MSIFYSRCFFAFMKFTCIFYLFSCCFFKMDECDIIQGTEFVVLSSLLFIMLLVLYKLDVHEYCILNIAET